MLCHLVESREIEASTIRVSELVQAYGQFLRDSERVPINTLGEFMALAARLLLGKLQALFPIPVPDEEELDPDMPDDIDEDELMSMLRRYRPYRKAAEILAELQKKRERHFFRSAEEGPASFDLGDLYGLSYFWWKLLARESARTGIEEDENLAPWEDSLYEEVPDVIPEEIQVDERMEELRELIGNGRTFSLNELLSCERSRPLLIVTLLALLELSRLGELNIRQKEVLGDVRISAAHCPVRN